MIGLLLWLYEQFSGRWVAYILESPVGEPINGLPRGKGSGILISKKFSHIKQAKEAVFLNLISYKSFTPLTLKQAESHELQLIWR